MTLQETLSQLQALGNPTMHAHNIKFGAGDNQYGVKMGDIRALAKKIKTDHALGLELWACGNIDAQFLATLVMKPKSLTLADLDRMVRVPTFVQVTDWFYSNIVKQHAAAEALRLPWLNDAHPMAARLGWSLTSGRVARLPEGLDLPALLDRLEAQMPSAAPEVQWTMNSTLAQIGICHAQYRERAIAIGESLGIYRNFPVSKGCTSPFAPIWIGEMVRRQG